MYFIPYKVNEFLENSFYQVPKELFINQYYTNLSLASKVLYGLLLDRLSLSIKNKWTDKDGYIYIIYTFTIYKRLEGLKQNSPSNLYLLMFVNFLFPS